MNTFHHNIDVRCDMQPWDRVVQFYIREVQNRDGIVCVYVAQRLEFKLRTEEEEGTMMAPAFETSLEDAQRFMDELWRAGLRPTEGTGSAGSLAATEHHLADMRALVASILKCELPK